MVYEYDEAFKEKVLKYHDDNPDVTIEDLANKFDIATSTFYNWKHEFEEKADDQADEIKELKEKLKEKTDALEILKKAKDLIESDH